MNYKTGVKLKSAINIKWLDNNIMEKDTENEEYDKYVNFYYTNLINAIILFSLTKEKLEELSGLAFDPLFELETEIDYAFTPVCFETIFRNGLVDDSFRTELLEFKKQTDNIPKDLWDWDYIDNHQTWIHVRQEANNLLDKLGVQQRTYNDDYTTIYDNNGSIIKKGKKL